MASTYLTRTISSAGSETKGTFSAWIKRSVLGGASDYIWHTSEDANNDIKILTNSSDSIRVRGINNGGVVVNLIPNKVFQDVSSWYHLVVAFDTTQATEADRVKMYVNGVQITSFSSATYPSQNLNLKLNQSGDRVTIGTAYDNGGSPAAAYWNGLMSQVIWVDGTAYAPTTFGSVNATSGEWTPNSSPSVTYGTNGYKLTFEDAVLGDDTSGNTNDFTMSGSGTSTKDCPSNVFATFNALDTFYTTPTFTNGNTTLELNPSSSKDTYVPTTLGMTSGKYYTEAKFISGVAYTYIGITDKPATASKILGDFTNSVRLRGDDGTTRINNVASTTLTSFTTNDIIGIAVDLTNLKIYYSKNGVWMNSANPSSGTGGLTITAPDHAYFFAWQCNSGSSVCKYSWNFGNGTFGTTAVASAGTNASGIGVFEYDVPTGYTALSTKGLNL